MILVMTCALLLGAGPVDEADAAPAERGQGVRSAKVDVKLRGELGLGPALTMSTAVSGGGSSSGGPTYLRTQARLIIDFLDLGPVQVAGILPLGLQFGSQSTFGTAAGTLAMDVPFSARVSGAVEPLRFYGELGVGPGFGWTTLNSSQGTTQTYFGAGTVFRLAAGLEYELLPGMHLFAEPMGLLVNSATTSYTFFGQTVTVTTTTNQWTMLFGVNYAFSP